MLVATVILVAGNSDRIQTKGNLGGAASRETVFLLNNVFLTAVMLTVLAVALSIGLATGLLAAALTGQMPGRAQRLDTP